MSVECDKILDWTEAIKVKLKDFPFGDDDTRRVFVELIYDSAYCYYRGIAFMEMMRLSHKNLFQYNIELRYFEPHVNRLVETTRLPILEKSQFNHLNRSLLLDAWSSFEFCVTTFTECIATEDERDKLLQYQFRSIIKEISADSVETKKMERLKNKLTAHSLVHVPIVRKTEFLFMKCSDYGDGIADDREFLQFVGKFRNAVHSNFIYHGKDYNYWLNNVHFVFKDRVPIVWTDRTTKVYFDLLDRLLLIWDRICMSLDYEPVCNHPHE